jgi:hypothetical protein
MLLFACSQHSYRTAVIVDFGKVIEQATKFHLLKIQTKQNSLL